MDEGVYISHRKWIHLSLLDNDSDLFSSQIKRRSFNSFGGEAVDLFNFKRLKLAPACWWETLECDPCSLGLREARAQIIHPTRQSLPRPCYRKYHCRCRPELASMLPLSRPLPCGSILVHGPYQWAIHLGQRWLLLDVKVGPCRAVVSNWMIFVTIEVYRKPKFLDQRTTVRQWKQYLFSPRGWVRYTTKLSARGKVKRNGRVVWECSC